MLQPHGQHVVPVGVDVRGDLNALADGSFNRKPTGVDLGSHVLYRDATPPVKVGSNPSCTRSGGRSTLAGARGGGGR